MNTMHGTLIRLAAISCFLAASATTATAQTTVRVSVDQSTIWTHDFGSPAAVVTSGTTLTVVGQRKDWYEVVVPGHDGASDPTGFIFKSLVGATTGPGLHRRAIGPSSRRAGHSLPTDRVR